MVDELMLWVVLERFGTLQQEQPSFRLAGFKPREHVLGNPVGFMQESGFQ